MEISLLQAFALGIIAFIAGLDMFNGLTHMHRPVVLGPLVGLVLGDLHTGILTGGTLELVWMGLAPLAGAQPPNVIIGTIVGTAFAITTGVKPDVAVGVAVPFAVAVQMGITFLFSVMSGVMSRCDRMAENADTRGIERVNYLALLALGTFYFLCAFLPIYFGAEHAKTIIDVLPQRLIDGLGVAGGIMPAIGFAVLLKIMMKNVYIPYFILGFVAAAWLKLPVLAIAAAALDARFHQGNWRGLHLAALGDAAQCLGGPFRTVRFQQHGGAVGDFLGDVLVHRGRSLRHEDGGAGAQAGALGNVVSLAQHVGRGAEFRRQRLDAFTRIGDLVRRPARQGMAPLRQVGGELGRVFL